ncbi:hypothetical protein [Massilia soli]|uniref:Lipoprotein n=1 Tax=Massilia soli TaxID=2792854 RepID=A0ABS7SLE1_9BURK|nr:hypothetical protein [Massilia soli]MBZ2206641.1 hypothetical protein [Massilia soli]
MKRIKHSVLLASLLTLALTACTRDRMGDTAATTSPDATSSAGYGTSGTSGQATGSIASDTGTASSGATGTGSMGAGTGGTAATTTDPQSAGAQASTGAAPNSVVTMIEVVPRSGEATGAGSMAGAAVGGTAGASGDRVYRITLRMDDGSTRVITQESAPTFRSGDRVNLSGGEIQRP